MSVVSLSAVAGSLPTFRSPEVNPKTLDEFSDAILECFVPWNTSFQLLADQFQSADKQSFKIIFPYSFYPSQEERDLKRDIDELQGYALFRGSKSAVTPIFYAALFNAMLSAYQVAFSTAQTKIQTAHRSEIVALVNHVEYGMRGPEEDRVKVLVSALERMKVFIPDMPTRE